jgi:hypothetical protein
VANRVIVLGEAVAGMNPRTSWPSRVRGTDDNAGPALEHGLRGQPRKATLRNRADHGRHPVRARTATGAPSGGGSGGWPKKPPNHLGFRFGQLAWARPSSPVRREETCPASTIGMAALRRSRKRALPQVASTPHRTQVAGSRPASSIWRDPVGLSQARHQHPQGPPPGHHARSDVPRLGWRRG